VRSQKVCDNTSIIPTSPFKGSQLQKTTYVIRKNPHHDGNLLRGIQYKFLSLTRVEDGGVAESKHVAFLQTPKEKKNVQILTRTHRLEIENIT